MSTFGRKTTSDPGIGIVVVGNQRGSIMGSTTYAAWITTFNGRFGKPTAGSATAYAQWAIYKSTSSVVTDFVGQSDGTTPITGVMDNGANGQTYTDKPLLPIQRFANQSYALMVRSDGGSFNHGQGPAWPMHRNAGYAWPNPYNADSANTEGKMTLWTEETPNTAPALPSTVSPVDGGYTVSGNPILAADFRDAEEVLIGFTLGQGDKLKKYQYKVLNQAKTSLLKDSGILDANGTQQTNRRSTWTVTSTALPAGTYVAQVTHYDMFDAPSAVKEWTFTVNAGGSLVVNLANASVTIADPLTTTSTTPSFTATWTHDSALYMTHWRAQLRRQSTNAIDTGPSSDVAQSVIAGGVFTPTDPFTSGGLVALTRGQSYRWEVQGKDTAGAWTPFATSPWFAVNAIPNTPDATLPASGTVTVTIPTLSARFTDPDNASSTLSPLFDIKLSGGTPTTISTGITYQGSDRWAVTPSAAVVNSTGIWEWRTKALDPAGTVSNVTAWQSFTLTTVPVISGLSPANGATITTGTPTITASVDRTVSNYRVQITLNNQPVYDSGFIVSGTISHAVPGATLRNSTTYTLVLTVTTSDGLVTTSTTTFTVAYPAEASPTSLTAIVSPGDFEPTADQYSEITLGWNPVINVADDPTLLALPLNGTLAGEDLAGPLTATGTGAVRFVTSGALIEEATTNHTLNPRAANDLTNIETGGAPLTRITNDGVFGTTSIDIAASGPSAGTLFYGATGAWSAGAHVFIPSVYAKGTGRLDVAVGVQYTDTTYGYGNISDYQLTGDWARYTGQSFITNAAKTVNLTWIYVRTSTTQATATTIRATAAQLEEKPYATSYTDGSQGTGCAWNGPAHASASTRAATSVSVPSASHISTTTGSIMLRLANVSAAGSNSRYLFGIGSYGTNDFIAINLSSGLPRLWTRVGANADVVLSSPVNVDGDAAATVYAEWTSTTLGISVNGETLLTVARGTAPTGTTGASLYVGSDANSLQQANATYGDLVTFDRVLTATERTALTGRPAAFPMIPAVDDANFGGYVVRRTDVATSVTETLAVLPTKAQTVYIDRTPQSGASYLYAVTYLHLINNLEWVESAAATSQQGVTLVNSVISDLAIGGQSIPLRYWDSRDVDSTTDTQVIPGFGRLPISFQGLLDYRTIKINYVLLDAENGTFTAFDLIDALREIKSVQIDADGMPVPRVLCWREPKRRVLYGSITSFSEDDQRPANRASGSLTFVENATTDEVT